MRRISLPSAAEISVAVERYELAARRKRRLEDVVAGSASRRDHAAAEIELMGADFELGRATNDLAKLIMLADQAKRC